MLAEEVYVNCYNCNPVRGGGGKSCITTKKVIFSRNLIKLSRAGSGAGAGDGARAGAAIPICGSGEPERKNYFRFCNTAFRTRDEF
jgi:hypothetical protein